MSEESFLTCLPGFSRPGEGKGRGEGIATGSEIWERRRRGKPVKGWTFLLHSQPSVSAEGAPTDREGKPSASEVKAWGVVRSKSVEASESEATLQVSPDVEG